MANHGSILDVGGWLVENSDYHVFTVEDNFYRAFLSDRQTYLYLDREYQTKEEMILQFKKRLINRIAEKHGEGSLTRILLRQSVEIDWNKMIDLIENGL